METESNIDTLRQCLKELSSQLDTELSLDDEGVCQFQVGDDLVIAIEADPEYGGIQLFANLLQLPEDEVEGVRLLTRALEMNCHATRLGNGAIAAMPGGGLLLYRCHCPQELITPEGLTEFFDSVCHLIDHLREDLQSSDIPQTIES